MWAASASAGSIEPEMIIHFPEGALACLSKDSLQAALTYAINNEKTKVDAMMVENGGDCVMLPPDKRMKVISVEYNDPDKDIGLLEVVGEEIISTNGAWTLSPGAVQVKDKQNTGH
jgi:hypothetical protein